MEETKQKVIIIGHIGDMMAMADAVSRLAHQLDVVCVTHLEAQPIACQCVDIDPPTPGNYCGPWSFDAELALDAKELFAAMMPVGSYGPPVGAKCIKAFPEADCGPQVYRGYMNSRRARRRNW